MNLNQNRRDFLSILAGAGAGLAFDPEMFGWVKRKTIFIPKPQLFYLKFYSVDIHFVHDNQYECDISASERHRPRACTSS